MTTGVLADHRYDAGTGPLRASTRANGAATLSVISPAFETASRSDRS